METGLRKLEAAVARQTVQDACGIGDSAWDALTAKMERLATATPRDLGAYDDRRSDGYGQTERAERTEREPGERESLRTSAQQIAAIMAPAGEDPALFMARVIANPAMTVSMWRQTLRPAVNQPGVAALTEVARMLRHGWTQAEVMDETGLSARQVERLGRVLGVVEWRKDREVAFATECAEEGMTVTESWNRWCQLVPPYLAPSLKTWRRRWQDAERILGAA